MDSFQNETEMSFSAGWPKMTFTKWTRIHFAWWKWKCHDGNGFITWWNWNELFQPGTRNDFCIMNPDSSSVMKMKLSWWELCITWWNWNESFQPGTRNDFCIMNPNSSSVMKIKTSKWFWFHEKSFPSRKLIGNYFWAPTLCLAAESLWGAAAPPGHYGMISGSVLGSILARIWLHSGPVLAPFWAGSGHLIVDK